MNTYNPFEKIDILPICMYQVAYLREVHGLSYREISDITDYAVSTCRNYASKYRMEARKWAEIFFTIPTVAVVVEPTVEPPKTLYRKFKDGRPAVAMEFMDGCGENIKGEEAFYFFKFFNPHSLEFNKIGTSAVDVIARLRDEIGEYSKKFDISRVEIHRIVSCNGLPAEGAESALRAELCRQYPTAYRKNDRFFGVDIDPEVIDRVLGAYFA